MSSVWLYDWSRDGTEVLFTRGGRFTLDGKAVQDTSDATWQQHMIAMGLLEGDEPFELASGMTFPMLTPDGKHQLVKKDNQIWVWDVETRKLLRIIVLLPEQQTAVFSPAGELLYASPKAEPYLAYVVEEISGYRRVLAQDEFLERVSPQE